ncbi:ROK family protein [candidate division KSB1 bacterium]|nr:ROK family protein [candidate division KSB1 bacterium]
MAIKKQNVFIGVDLGATNIKFGLVLPDGNILLERKSETEIHRGVNYVFDKVADFTHTLADYAGENYELKGFGIGVPGLIDTRKKELVEASNFPDWRDIKIGYELEKRLNLEIYIDNDANLAALGEYAFGAGRGVTEMLMVTLGSGVGSGLILNGSIYHGSKGAAGEFGHIIIQQNGPLCSCGSRGCVEAFVGKNAILRRMKEILQQDTESILKNHNPTNMTPEDIYFAAEKGDKPAIRLFKEVGESLGVGLGNIANLLNLERIVIGGGIANAGDLILNHARKVLSENALKTNRESIEIVKAELGERAGIVGAAKLAMMSLN